MAVDIISPLAIMPYPMPGGSGVLRTFKTSEDPNGKKVSRPFRRQTRRWFGFCVHTTGSGPWARAEEFTKAKTLGRERWSPENILVWIYQQAWMGCPHYAIEADGTIYVFTSEHLIAPHCGAQAWMRSRMLDGTWRQFSTPNYVTRWEKRWPGVKSPQHLFPTASGNEAYAGAEIRQLKKRDCITGMFQSVEQYEALGELEVDFEVRNGIQIDGKRSVYHEDLIPFLTKDKGRVTPGVGGWDPGVNCVDPLFDVRRHVEARDKARAKRTRVTV